MGKMTCEVPFNIPGISGWDSLRLRRVTMLPEGPSPDDALSKSESLSDDFDNQDFNLGDVEDLFIDKEDKLDLGDDPVGAIHEIIFSFPETIADVLWHRIVCRQPFELIADDLDLNTDDVIKIFNHNVRILRVEIRTFSKNQKKNRDDSSGF